MLFKSIRSASLPNYNKFFCGRMRLFIMTLPFVILVFMFSYIPLFGWIYAFFDYKPGIPLFNSDFVGLKYFKLAFFEGSELGYVLRNTLMLSFLGILTTPLPAIMAILISEIKNKAFRRIVQSTTTLPNFISWIIIFSLFFSLFSTEGQFNQLLLKYNIVSQPVEVLGNSDIAWYIQTAISLWKGLGWGAIIYLAAISGIDNELYDAAKVDGASRFKTILHVTVPGLYSTYFVLLLLGISNVLSNGFEQYFVFNNALVADKLDVLDYYVYRMGIAAGDYSFATALGVFKTFVSIALLFIANLLSKKLRGQTIV